MWEVNMTCVAILGCTMPYMMWLGLRERREWAAGAGKNNNFVETTVNDDENVEMVKIL